MQKWKEEGSQYLRSNAIEQRFWLDSLLVRPSVHWYRRRPMVEVAAGFLVLATASDITWKQDGRTEKHSDGRT